MYRKQAQHITLDIGLDELEIMAFILHGMAYYLQRRKLMLETTRGYSALIDSNVCCT